MGNSQKPIIASACRRVVARCSVAQEKPPQPDGSSSPASEWGGSNNVEMRCVFVRTAYSNMHMVGIWGFMQLFPVAGYDERQVATYESFVELPCFSLMSLNVS